ncbi:LAMI_0C07338g1_1 [Lachancea mirantina]|uniref:N-(5'-phosphoribosyl)anthranilate isomerase n=1 Tax=Lachancea mirantina TaxID=1230905 RepID=A0A1G4J463_9SACH|nr:LAMI_0C07338g1_1 [Lachancea mirantina]
MLQLSQDFIIKICGIQTVEAAEVAINEGATFLGVICVPNRKRTIEPNTAKKISDLVERRREQRQKESPQKDVEGPFLVGVFRNQQVEEVLAMKDEYKLDIVQLHGSENWKEYREKVRDCLIIKRFIFPKDCTEVEELSNVATMSETCIPLFDSEAGGTGEILDWEEIASWSRKSRAKFLLAGGLNPENVHKAVELPGVIGIDVSGGVETDGRKDNLKITKFIRNAKADLVR